MKIAVLGGGAWGTALAHMLAKSGAETMLWARNEQVVADIRDKQENTLYLPGVKLSPGLRAESDPATAFAGADYYLIAIPSQSIRATLSEHKDLFPDDPVTICASKGIELDSLKPMSKVVAEALEGKRPRYAMLSGPSFADEVCRELPTTVSLGCEDHELGRELQEVLSTSAFRVYFTPDFRGVELGGAVKNVIAIGAGMADGLNFGHDARAAIITRGLAEISRLGTAMGGQQRTFMGLSGMGDLVLTCTGDLSRNRQVGLKLGKGQKLAGIINEMNAVAEGVKTTKALHELAKKLNVVLPITAQVYSILYEDKDPAEAVQDLLRRDLTDE
jgi:glycerol-3-phosphate dehydrogenase (NAD(P)+)